MFDVSEARPNIFFELGFAEGIRRLYFLICAEGRSLPSDLAGYEVIYYKSYKDLEGTLREKVAEMVALAAASRPRQFLAHIDLVKPILEEVKKGPVSLEQLKQVASEAGFADEDLNHFMVTLGRSVFQKRGDKLAFAHRGQEALERMVRMMERS